MLTAFPGNNDFMNAPQGYVITTLPVLYKASWLRVPNSVMTLVFDWECLTEHGLLPVESTHKMDNKLCPYTYMSVSGVSYPSYIDRNICKIFCGIFYFQDFFVSGQQPGEKKFVINFIDFIIVQMTRHLLTRTNRRSSNLQNSYFVSL
jgi:hypothetical protein